MALPLPRSSPLTGLSILPPQCIPRYRIPPSCYRVLFRHFKVRWIVQESPIYHRVEGKRLYQNQLSVSSAKYSFSRYTTSFISVTENWGLGAWERITNQSCMKSATLTLNIVVPKSAYKFHFKKPI